MCCFSRPVERVEQTRIYARADGARQLVVYELKLVAEGELAMVLPVPVASGAAEEAIEFVDLTSSPAFFGGLEYAFRATGAHEAQELRKGGPQARLAVREVGAFEASFVPRAEDFDRLDPRFAIPSSLWAGVPAVRGFGFVVFKLRGGARVPRGIWQRLAGTPPASPRAFHPMAFWFPRRDGTRTFFPTLHVHDGSVHATATFDHVLYAQGVPAPLGWRTSPHSWPDGIAGVGRGLVLDEPGHRIELRGTLPNADTWIDG